MRAVAQAISVAHTGTASSQAASENVSAIGGKNGTASTPTNSRPRAARNSPAASAAPTNRRPPRARNRPRRKRRPDGARAKGGKRIVPLEGARDEAGLGTHLM